jgi:hypothetical protein
MVLDRSAAGQAAVVKPENYNRGMDDRRVADVVDETAAFDREVRQGEVIRIETAAARPCSSRST